jgi:hypothetical protein
MKPQNPSELGFFSPPPGPVASVGAVLLWPGNWYYGAAAAAISTNAKSVMAIAMQISRAILAILRVLSQSPLRAILKGKRANNDADQQPKPGNPAIAQITSRHAPMIDSTRTNIASARPGGFLGFGGFGGFGAGAMLATELHLGQRLLFSMNSVLPPV